MWFFALAAFLTNVIRMNHFIGVTLSVAYLILINPPTLLLLKRITQMRLYRYASLLINFLEVLGYTAIIYSLGGIEASFITPIYAALIMYVGPLSPRSFPFVISIMCSAAFGFVVAAEYFGFLPHQHLFLPSDPPLLTQLSHLSVVIGLLFVVAYISSFTGSMLKKSRSKLREQTAELITANEKLKQRTEELVHSNKELEQFAYVASHDLQEPLRAVTSYVQLLARRYQNRLDSDAEEFINFALDGATRMHTLINGLLAYSRVGTQAKPFEPTNCETILQQSLDNLKMTMEETGAVVTHDSLPTVMADSLQLGQLFQNLIGNAIKFHGDQMPRVHISVRPDGNQWIFSVRDNGIGIAPEFTEHIFLIFQRLHGKEKYPGTGIGLALCKKIVEYHGGRIWVESEVEKGATFYFTLPRQGEQ